MPKKPVTKEEKPEMVNHPAHYNQGKFEVIDVIDDWKLGFYEGQIVKYVARARYKEDRIGDLKKAAWYLARRISILDRQVDNLKKAR